LANRIDLYNEVFEIIDSCTFAAKSISPTMWQAFELIHATFKAGAELYLEDMLPALDNFVQYGASELVNHPQYLDAMYSMVQDMFVDEKVGGVDRICACKLAEGMMLSIPKPHISNHVVQFVSITSSSTNHGTKNNLGWYGDANFVKQRNEGQILSHSLDGDGYQRYLLRPSMFNFSMR